MSRAAQPTARRPPGTTPKRPRPNYGASGPRWTGIARRDSELRELLSAPDRSRAPRDVGSVSITRDDLDAARQAAVRQALGADDFVLVQGRRAPARPPSSPNLSRRCSPATQRPASSWRHRPTSRAGPRAGHNPGARTGRGARSPRSFGQVRRWDRDTRPAVPDGRVASDRDGAGPQVPTRGSGGARRGHRHPSTSMGWLSS